MAPEDPTEILTVVGSSSNTPSSTSMQQQQRQHSIRRPDSPPATFLSDATSTAAAAAASPLPEPHALPAIASIAAGPSNTLLVTRSGRVLVCGASCSGHCGSAWVKAAVCPGFVDMGPEVSWHGLMRPSAADVEAAGGSVTAALSKVCGVGRGVACRACEAKRKTCGGLARPSAAEVEAAGGSVAAALSKLFRTDKLTDKPLSVSGGCWGFSQCCCL